MLDYRAKDILCEGEMAGKMEIALNMHKDGVKEDLIAKYANVSIELVKKWIGLQPA